MSYCQCAVYGSLQVYTFEGDYSDYNCLFYRDVTDTVSPWQIGKPLKTTFDTAYSGTRVIVTDSAGSYKPNDTSSFTVKLRSGSGIFNRQWCAINGYYYVNSDILTDYGTIEFSPDNGHSWINLLYDTAGVANWEMLGSVRPMFSGNSLGWKFFRCDLNFAGTPYALVLGDTVMYRFTFISDTIDTHKDGLMFDNLFFEDWTEDVPTITNTNHIISLYPNPATNSIHIQSPTNTSQKRLHILNYTGALIKEINNFTGNEIDVSYLPPGIYMLKYTDEQFSDAVPFYIQR